MYAKDHPGRSGTSIVPGAVGRLLGEAALVAAVGAAVAFAANLLSPQGLSLTRDYFPSGIAHEVRPVAGGGLASAAGTNSAVPSAAQALAAQMKAKGLQLVDERQTLQYFHDPLYRQGVIVFIDARDEAEYQQGHIPGAYDFDPYHPDKYFAAVLPACQQASQIVVYCNGGDCDDSETAALLLRDVGIPNQKLFVYGGGFTEWQTTRLPVELGARNSGTLLKTNTVINPNVPAKTNQ